MNCGWKNAHTCRYDVTSSACGASLVTMALAIVATTTLGVEPCAEYSDTHTRPWNRIYKKGKRPWHKWRDPCP